MFLCDDIQEALDFYATDDTQWIITDGTQYGLCEEAEACHALDTLGWVLTSPEELARALRQ
jgi:hypothetical protein